MNPGFLFPLEKFSKLPSLARGEPSTLPWRGGSQKYKVISFFLILILLIPLILLSKRRLYAYCWCAILLLLNVALAYVQLFNY